MRHVTFETETSAVHSQLGHLSTLPELSELRLLVRFRLLVWTVVSASTDTQTDGQTRTVIVAKFTTQRRPAIATVVHYYLLSAGPVLIF